MTIPYYFLRGLMKLQRVLSSPNHTKGRPLCLQHIDRLYTVSLSRRNRCISSFLFETKSKEIHTVSITLIVATTNHPCFILSIHSYEPFQIFLTKSPSVNEEEKIHHHSRARTVNTGWHPFETKPVKAGGSAVWRINKNQPWIYPPQN